MVANFKRFGRGLGEKDHRGEKKEWAGEKGYDPVFGARPLKRFLQRNIETQLARALIAGAVAEGSEVTFVVKGDALTMK